MAKKRSSRAADIFFDQNVMRAIGILAAIYVSNYIHFPYGILTAIGIYIAALYVNLPLKTRLSKTKKTVKPDMKELDAMKGIDFTRYLADLFENMGYIVKFTPAAKGQGADLLLRKRNRRIAVQAKRDGSIVGVKAIKEADRAREFYRTNEAWVITNNTFTKSACQLAEKEGVKVVDRDQLIHLISKKKTTISSAK